MHLRLRSPLLFLLACLISVPAVRACNVPVFRYALERWRAERVAERYQVVLFHQGPLKPEEQKALAILRDGGAGSQARANFDTQVVDLAGKVAVPLRQLWQAQGQAMLPWLVVRYTESAAEGASAWAGRFSETVARRLVDSPARHELARRLLQGETAVWVLLESGARERDDAAAALVQAELKKLEKTLKLPEGLGEGPVKLLSALPVTISFSLLRIARQDEAEELTVAMLRHTDKDVARSDAPIVFPVFGRGRVLDALIGKGINRDNLQETAAFLCGACSCQVKALNPGVDLLMTADWDTVLADRSAVEPTASSGTGELMPVPRRPVAAPSPDGPKPAPWGPLAIVLAGFLVLAAGALLLRKRRAGKRRPFAIEERAAPHATAKPMLPFEKQP